MFCLPIGSGLFLEAHVYGQPGCSGAQCCLAFLSNIRSDGAAVAMTLLNHTFQVPAWSVSLVDCSSWQVCLINLFFFELPCRPDVGLIDLSY